METNNIIQTHPYNESGTQPLNIDSENSIHPNPPKRSSRRYCITKLTLVLLGLFIILSLVISTAWLVIHPHDPDFRLNSISVSNISLSNLQFNATYDIEFAVNNTNKNVNLFIDHIKVDVTYEKHLIAERVVPETVAIGKTKLESWEVELGTDSVRAVKGKVFRDISDDWSKRMVNLDVIAFIRTTYVHKNWPSKKRLSKVSCVNLPVEFVSTKGTGKLMSGGKDCVLHPV